jgi:hypothetical protein
MQIISNSNSTPETMADENLALSVTDPHLIESYALWVDKFISEKQRVCGFDERRFNNLIN